MSSAKFCATLWIEPKQGKVYTEEKLEYYTHLKATIMLNISIGFKRMWEVINKKGVTYLYFSLEKGLESNRLHLQMYLEYHKKTTIPTIAHELKNTWLDNAHYEIARGSLEANWAYCGKLDETHVEGPFEFGTPRIKNQGARNDLRPMIDDIRYENLSSNQIARKYPEVFMKYHKGVEKLCDAASEEQSMLWSVKERKKDLKVIVIWGAPGVGKTRRVYESHPIEEIYSLRRPNGNSLWFDGYHMQKVLLIDEFKGWIKFQQFLKLIDIYPIQVDKKGSTAWNNWRIVYICSNKDPNDWYPGISRYERQAMFRRFTVVEEILPDEADDSSRSDFVDDDNTSERTQGD